MMEKETLIEKRDKVHEYMDESSEQWQRAYTFINGSVAECFSFEVDRVVDELTEEELDMIMEYLGI